MVEVPLSQGPSLCLPSLPGRYFLGGVLYLEQEPVMVKPSGLRSGGGQAE